MIFKMLVETAVEIKAVGAIEPNFASEYEYIQ